ncbi:hypothetical protein LIER_04854 [Lithospermum erythrorhizon]|uniref:Uncharacterized protein n=1 Tax=Lithospermum erythrorhizon TaxID=34254 RepID=A0AAV3P2D4_LITER
MSGLDANLALHRLHADPSFKPVKQKRRNFLDERNLAIQQEIEELVKANAIRELQFPEWIANVVMISSDTPPRRRSGKKGFYYGVRVVLLESDAIHIEECEGHLSEDR